MKKSKSGGSKASHLTIWVTRAWRTREIARAPLLATTTAFANRTLIEDDVKIGSDTMLVAPVRVGRGSVTGAGSVVTKDVPPDSLAVGVPAVIRKKLK